jgi:hypothetical protein
MVKAAGTYEMPGNGSPVHPASKAATNALQNGDGDAWPG